MRFGRTKPESGYSYPSGHCPEGYEYVHGYRDGKKYVRPFCRKIPKKRVKLSVDVRYPGNTKVKVSARQGWHGGSVSETVPTESLFNGEDGKELREVLDSDWKDLKEMKVLTEKKKE